jgi:hypothetical protein
MEREAWSHTAMVLLTRAKGEILGPLWFWVLLSSFVSLASILELHLLLCLMLEFVDANMPCFISL